MGKTHRRRDNADWHRFQRAMQVETSAKARSWRKRDRWMETLAITSWHTDRYQRRPAPVRNLMEDWHEAQAEV